MDGQTILTVLLVAAVGVVAYVVGQRRALAQRAPAPASEAKPEPQPQLQAKAEPPAIAPHVATQLTPLPSASDSGTPGPMSSTKPSAALDAIVPILPLKAPVITEVEDGGPVRLTAEEDDEVEPTRVGPAASAPPSERVIRLSPIRKIVLDDEAASEPQESPSMFLISATAQTDKGLRRKRNEDSLGILEDANLFIVADGMGGYAGGEQASRLAVETIIDAYRTRSFEGDPHEDVGAAASELARAIQMANASISEHAQKHYELKDMGTTVCAAVFSPSKQRLVIGHVGDSRCYRLRDGVFTQLTADHTMAEEGVRGPESQQLSRAVGIWPTVMIDLVMSVPRTGDVYLLCSDGLTKMLDDTIIGNVLRNEEDPKQAVERLIFFANSRGGKDNITVVLVRVVPLDWRPKASEPFRRANSDPPPSSSAPASSKGPPAGASHRPPPSKPRP
jgi:protein phosphatase